MTPDESVMYEGVGRFITAFAGAEAGVHLIARKLSRLDDEIARLFFHSMRLADLTDRTRALLRIETDDGVKPVLTGDPAKIIEACLTQLTLVAARRHSLVHRVTGWGANGLFVTNILNSKSSEHSEWDIFTLPELTAMTKDCEDIFNQLERLSSSNSRVTRAVAAGVPAWRYKPAKPASPNPQHQKGSGSRPRQPRPSQA